MNDNPDTNVAALVELGSALRAKGYRFVAVTPDTHRRVIERKREASTLEDVFGWNVPFERNAVDAAIYSLLEAAAAVEFREGRAKSRVRFATIGDLLFVHSGFPTSERDAVFFGPDTYRFVRALGAALHEAAGSVRLVDIGCGSGAGGIFAASHLSVPMELVLADINPKALAYSAVNAVINHRPTAVTVLSDVLDGVAGDADLIIANPPYLIDEEKRLYRDGGGSLGVSLALRIAGQSLARLRPGGRLVLYTGVPIIAGVDPFFQALRPLLQPYGRDYSYEEIDPDVFGEELDNNAYATADRIAAVVLTVIRKD